MAQLDGFKLITLKEKVEESTLTITAKALKFNRGTARDLGRPEKVRFFVNEKLSQLAIAPAQAEDEDGVDFSYVENTREMSISIKEAAILSAVKKLTALEKDGQPLKLKVKGNVDIEERTIIYDFHTAETVTVKPREKRAGKKAEK